MKHANRATTPRMVARVVNYMQEKGISEFTMFGNSDPEQPLGAFSYDLGSMLSPAGPAALFGHGNDNDSLIRGLPADSCTPEDVRGYVTYQSASMNGVKDRVPYWTLRNDGTGTFTFGTMNPETRTRTVGDTVTTTCGRN